MHSQKISHRFFSILLNIKINIRMYVKILMYFIWFYILFLGIILATFEHKYFINIIDLFSAGISCLFYFKLNYAVYNFSNGISIFYEIIKWIMIKNWYIWLLLPVILYVIKPKNNTIDYHVRGAKIISAEELRLLTKKETCFLPCGKIKMPISAEIKHSFIVGRPGTGKTNCFNQLIESIQQRKEKTLIYDYKGDFLAKFFNPKIDIIFNPLDIRCVGWNIFNDIETVMDINAVASALIPESSKNADPFWNNAARDILIGVLHHCVQNNLRTNADVWNICKLPLVELAQTLRDTKGAETAQKYFEDIKSKTLPGIMSIFAQYSKVFDYMQYIDGDFSVKQWLKNDEKNSIFLTNYADIKDTLKPVISLFIDTIGRKLLSMPDNVDNRFFILLDEFGTLQRLNTIIQLLTLSRSKGGAVFIGIQDIGQIDNLYGKELRSSLINACGNNIIFSVKDPVTADFFSEKIGDTEYYENRQSQSYGQNSDRLNINQHKQKERLILPSDIMNLQDLTCYLILVNYDLCLTTFEYKKFEELSVPFIMREQYMLNNDAIRHIESMAQEINADNSDELFMFEA